jgi:hypothetical protein
MVARVLARPFHFDPNPVKTVVAGSYLHGSVRPLGVGDLWDKEKAIRRSS